MRIKKLEDGLSSETIRELECCKRLHSEYIVTLLDFYAKEGSTYLIYEYMPSDLHTLLNSLLLPLTESQIKAVLYMILKCVAFCHKHQIMHRVMLIALIHIKDLKPSNLLISKDNVIKLSDFGLGKVFSLNSDKTPSMNTLEVGTRYGLICNISK